MAGEGLDGLLSSSSYSGLGSSRDRSKKDRSSKDSRKILLDPVHAGIYETLQNGIRLNALTIGSLLALNAATITATLPPPRTFPVTFAGLVTEDRGVWRCSGTQPRLP